MDELLSKALAGVEPGTPGAFRQLFENLMALVPWGWLTALTLLWVGVAVAIAWRRGTSLWRAVIWALVVGPIAWPIAWLHGHRITPCPRCATPVPAGRARCPHCGAAVTRRVQTAARP